VKNKIRTAVLHQIRYAHLKKKNRPEKEEESGNPRGARPNRKIGCRREEFICKRPNSPKAKEERVKRCGVGASKYYNTMRTRGGGSRVPKGSKNKAPNGKIRVAIHKRFNTRGKNLGGRKFTDGPNNRGTIHHRER